MATRKETMIGLVKKRAFSSRLLNSRESPLNFLKKRIQLISAGCISCILFAGCNSREAYEFTSTETNATVYSQLLGDLTPIQFVAVGFILYVAKYIGIISLFSISLGLIILVSIKNSPRIRKNAIVGLIIGVPLIAICLYVLAKMIAATAGV